MDNLPAEILEIILRNKDLHVRDVLNVALANKQLYLLIIGMDFLWKHIFENNWPKVFDPSHCDWYNELKYIYELRNRAVEELRGMSSKFMKISNLYDEDFKSWKDLIKETPNTYNYVTFHLHNIIHKFEIINSVVYEESRIYGNYTLRYYALKVLHYLNVERVRQEWIAYVLTPEQTFERVTMLIAKWCQPNEYFDYANVYKTLDKIEEQVKKELKRNHPQHPLFHLPAMQLDLWRRNQFQKTFWNTCDASQIINAIDCVNKEIEIANSRCENFYINKVLENKKGSPITILAIHEIVARRLGIECIPVKVESQIVLNYTNCTGEQFYLDTSTENVNLTKILPNGKLRGGVSAQAIATTMGHQILHSRTDSTCVRSILEFILLIDPGNVNNIFNLAKLYTRYNIEGSSVQNLLRLNNSLNEDIGFLSIFKKIKQNFDDDSQKYQIKIKNRTKNVEFAVGMVMEHTILDFICVICDWDLCCKETLEWQFRKKIPCLKHGSSQPFYTVLVDNGSTDYIAQECLNITTRRHTLDKHADLGRHFSHFFGNHFVPNGAKEKEYPEDQNVRIKFYQQTWASS